MIKPHAARMNWTKWVLKISAITAVLGLAALAMPARTQAQLSLFGGYSYMRPSVPVGRFIGTPPTVSRDTNLYNGWEVAGKVSFFPTLGAVADFGGNYGTLYGATVRTHTYLFGPQLQLPGKVEPFVHVLVGAAEIQQDPIPSATYYTLGKDTSFATAVGGGIDVKVVPFVAVRLFQIDYLRTQWYGMSQNQARVSAGIVLHF